MEVKGHTGTVSFDGDFITITRKGFLARATVGKGDKRIPLRSVTAVQWKPAGLMVNGYIEFSLGGGNERRSAFGNATTGAVQNENAIVFTKKQMPEFVKFREAIEYAISRLSNTAPLPTSSNITSAIKELDELHKQGILTKEEFENKKSDLLKRI